VLGASLQPRRGSLRHGVPGEALIDLQGQRGCSGQGRLIVPADAVGDRLAPVTRDRLQPGGQPDVKACSVGTPEAAVAGVAQERMPVGEA
jgi:hypothetical protein